MELEPVAIFIWSFVGVVTLGLAWVVTTVFSKPTEEVVHQGQGDGEKNGDAKKGKKKVKTNVAVEKAKKPRSRTESQTENSHIWSAAVFKGHGGNITDMDWSSNGKFIASCAQDRTILIWFAKDLLSKDRRSIRVNVPFDNARLISWSPDCTAFIVARESEKLLEVFKLGKKAEGSHVTVNSLTTFKKVHEVEIVGLGIACNGLYIMSCSKDGNMIIWDLKGGILERVKVPMEVATCAKVSPCGRYVAVCGNDCLMFAVNFNEMKEFQSVKTYGKLKGQESKVECVDFNADSTRIVTITENGIWRLFDTTGSRINVICMGQAKNGLSHYDSDEFVPTVSLSPDGRIVAVGYNNQVDVFEVKLGSPFTSIDPSWTIPSDGVRKIVFSADGKFLLTSGDKSIRVFHNVCGYYASIQDLSQQIQDPSTNSSMKSRMSVEFESVAGELKKLKLGSEFAEQVKQKLKTLKTA